MLGSIAAIVWTKKKIAAVLAVLAGGVTGGVAVVRREPPPPPPPPPVAERPEPRPVAVEREEPPVKRKERMRRVRTGDTLWEIAERQTGGDASDSKVARRVRVLARLNELPDPDLIPAGGRLRLRS